MDNNIETITKCTMFHFLKYVNNYYDYLDNTNNGDIYIDKETSTIFTEHEIYIRWKIKYRNDSRKELKLLNNDLYGELQKKK